MKKRKSIIYTHTVNCKVTNSQYNDLLKAKEISGISISTMMRDNIAFLLAYYQPKT
jgi:hypothetical protein